VCSSRHLQGAGHIVAAILQAATLVCKPINLVEYVIVSAGHFPVVFVVFSAIFIRTNAISNLLWKFQRYILVIEYEERPILPPPLVILCHIYLLGKYIRRKCQGKRKYLDNGLSK